jgi:hypothetical protein
MNAAAENIATQPVEQEFMLTATDGDHHLSGCEVGLVRALTVARALALTGWKVRVTGCDPYFEDPLVMEVWCEPAP